MTLPRRASREHASGARPEGARAPRRRASRRLVETQAAERRKRNVANSKARRKAMEGGTGAQIDDPGLGDFDKFSQAHKVMSSLAEAERGGGLSQAEMKKMKIAFKYKSNELWPDQYEPSDYDTDMRRQNRSLAKHCGSPLKMMQERQRLLEQGKAKKIAFQRGQIDCLKKQGDYQKLRDGFYSKRTEDYDMPDDAEIPTGQDLDEQRRVNKIRRKKLAGTQWQFGLTNKWQCSFTTTMHDSISAGVNSDSLAELVEAKENAKVLKKNLTQTTLQLGGETWS